jgi:hypothetical protein
LGKEERLNLLSFPKTKLRNHVVVGDICCCLPRVASQTRQPLGFDAERRWRFDVQIVRNDRSNTPYFWQSL